MVRPLVHDFVRDLYRDADLREHFEAVPQEALMRYGFQADELDLLLAGDFKSLHELGMHPLAQMIYSLARFPAMKEKISARDYLADLG